MKSSVISLRGVTRICAGVLVAGGAAIADEGIWLFNQFPKKKVAEQHKSEVTDSFLRRLQSASVRLSDGGSGSIVSPRGLLFTNHHVASECIQKLSNAKHDFMNSGFYAGTDTEELPCADLEVNLLLGVEDVTTRVTEGITATTEMAEENRRKKAAMTRIEKECTEKTGSRCDAVTLYSGGQYHLYRYKKYTDVRLAFAPEVAIGAFGGDPDNFTYPRYCFDIAFFRLYENGQPVDTPNYLKWSAAGVRDGELTFVSGHPGTTGRLATLAELEFSRDVSYPLVVNRLASLIETLQAFSARSGENRRMAHDNLFSQQNSFKAYSGFLRGLRDPALTGRKRDEEQALRAAVAANPQLQQKCGATWDEVAGAYRELREFYRPYWLLERGAGRGSEMFTIARDVFRYAEEKTKPNEQRLREYVDPALPSLEREMFSPAPIHPEMEIAVLADYLQFLRQELGAADPTVKELLGSKTPRKAAEEYVRASKLDDVAERKRLSASLETARKSEDGLVRLVRAIDVRARHLRKRYEDRVEAAVQSGASRIAMARFELRGAEDYPDATFTLRLSYGPVKGYMNSRHEWVPYATDFAGLYRRATGKDPFRLPERWRRAKGELNLSTPFNFVTTCDTHGGNSGSPTVNTQGEIIGIIFDGNLEGLPNRFVYTEAQARSIHVAGQAIVEALRKVYRARRLLEELGQAAN